MGFYLYARKWASYYNVRGVTTMNNFFDNMNMYDSGFNSFKNMYQDSLDGFNKNGNKLTQKFKGQAGDNMTFNMCGYDGKTNRNELFDVYNGFIRGNMFPVLFNQYKLSRPYDIKPMNEQADLLTKVDAYCFAAHDINLYLDTHPDDKDMFNLFKELSKDSDMAIREYEEKFGPLFVDSSSFPWSWNNCPWPWEND